MGLCLESSCAARLLLPRLGLVGSGLLEGLHQRHLVRVGARVRVRVGVRVGVGARVWG